MPPRDARRRRPPRPEPIRSGRGGGLGRDRASTLLRIGGEAPEDLLDDRGIVQGGDQAQPSPQLGEGGRRSRTHRAQGREVPPKGASGGRRQCHWVHQGYEPPRLTRPPVAATCPSRASSALVKAVVSPR